MKCKPNVPVDRGVGLWIQAVRVHLFIIWWGVLYIF